MTIKHIVFDWAAPDEGTRILWQSRSHNIRLSAGSQQLCGRGQLSVRGSDAAPRTPWLAPHPADSRPSPSLNGEILSHVLWATASTAWNSDPLQQRSHRKPDAFMSPPCTVTSMLRVSQRQAEKLVSLGGGMV